MVPPGPTQYSFVVEGASPPSPEGAARNGPHAEYAATPQQAAAAAAAEYDTLPLPTKGLPLLLGASRGSLRTFSPRTLLPPRRLRRRHVKVPRTRLAASDVTRTRLVFGSPDRLAPALLQLPSRCRYWHPGAMAVLIACRMAARCGWMMADA